MELIIETTYNNYGIVNLIESQKKLTKLRLLDNCKGHDKSFHEVIENSLIKHASTIQHLRITRQPVTKILSSSFNLRVLELNGNEC